MKVAPVKAEEETVVADVAEPVNNKPEVWIELVDKDTPPVKIARPASEDSEVPVDFPQQKPEIWIQTDLVQPVESSADQASLPVADSQIKPAQEPEKDQPAIYNEEIIVSSPGLAVEAKPVSPIQTTIGIPERVEPANEDVQAPVNEEVQAVQAPVNEALVAEDLHIDEKKTEEHQNDEKKGDDCKVEYVLVAEDKVTDEAQQQQEVDAASEDKPARFESRLNSRGQINSKELRHI